MYSLQLSERKVAYLENPSTLGDESISELGRDGRWAGLEHRILNRCKELLQETKATSEVHTFGLNKGAKGYEVQPLDSLCGGQVTISLELMLPMPHILLMGGGHCSEAISKLLPKKGWNYSVQDTREAFTTTELYPEAIERSHSTVEAFFNNETAESLSRFSDVLLLGHDYSEDLDRLQRLLQLAEGADVSPDGKAFPRIGAIGSRSKWKSFTDSCIEVGIQPSSLDRVRCPIGLNIGAESPKRLLLLLLQKFCRCTKMLMFMLQIGEISEAILWHRWMSLGRCETVW